MYSALTNNFDSAVKLAWIENEKKQYKQSVQNHVTEELSSREAITLIIQVG